MGLTFRWARFERLCFERSEVFEERGLKQTLKRRKDLSWGAKLRGSLCELVSRMHEFFETLTQEALSHARNLRSSPSEKRMIPAFLSSILRTRLFYVLY